MKLFNKLIIVLFMVIMALSVNCQEIATDSVKSSTNKNKQKHDKTLYLDWDADDVYAGIPKKTDQDRSECSETEYEVEESREARRNWHIERSTANVILNILLAALWVASYY